MMAELVNLVRWEWFRLSRRVGFRVLAGLSLLVLLMALGALAGLYAAGVQLEVAFGYFDLLPYALGGTTPLLAMALAALLNAGALQGGHFRTLTARGTARGMVLAAKLLTGGLLLLAYHLIGVLLAGIFALALPPGFEGWRDGMIDSAASFENSLLYLAVGALLAHWRQSTAVTVGVGITLVVFESIAYPVAGQLGVLLDWPVNEVAAWTVWGVTRGLQGNGEGIARVWYVGIVAAYAGVLMGVAYARLRRSDLRDGGE